VLKTGDALLEFPPLSEGVLLKRYKRFLAEVKLENGEIVTAHCPNTGPMKGVLKKNGRVRLRYAPSPTRKLSWSWEQAEVINEKGFSCWVGVNTALSNKLVYLAIESGCLKEELGLIQKIRQEVVYGLEGRSRIDLLLYPDAKNLDNRLIYIEVKNTTWTEGSLALFPDTVTKRGQKHLKDLMGVLPQARSVLVPCISREDVYAFSPGDSADEQYGNLYRLALKSGVEVVPCCFGFQKGSVTWEGKKPFNTHQKIEENNLQIDIL
tara:strand:+ start:427 stop:1221 length:795 start_codon:yes stop_codon:yes gene_type:complete